MVSQVQFLVRALFEHQMLLRGRVRQLGKGRQNMNWQTRLVALLKELASDDEGADLVEYVLLISFVAFGATAGLMPVATSIGNVFDKANSQLASAAGAGASSGGSASSSGSGDGSGDGGGHGDH
jgi:Flp pilus assembly pilin Flp